jgi:Zn-dependent protease with chaperone function
MADRITLTQLSSVAWEHPADRAALNTLRALPGFDEVVRKVAGAIGERGVRNLFLANAVRVGDGQRPKLDALWNEVLETMDWPERPQLYVTQTPFANAGAIGFERPFVVLNSGALSLLDRDEQRFVLAHELGHIMSGHVTYRTLAVLILTFGLSNLPFVAGVALLPFQLALLEWYRKAELSCDRAGLLGVQDPRAAQMVFLKLAGGGAGDDSIDLDAFMKQAAEYETGGSAWDTVLKALNTAMREHPFATVRAGELQRWVAEGSYERILAGGYTKRGTEGERPLREDYREAGDYYAKQARAAADQVSDVFGRAATAFRDAFDDAFATRGRGGPQAPPAPDDGGANI